MTMVIVAGHVTVAPAERESYLTISAKIVERPARQRVATLSVSVAEYDVADERPMSGKGKGR